MLRHSFRRWVKSVAADRDDRFLIPAILAGITGISAVIRLYALGSRPFWADEAVYTLAAMEIVENLRLVPHYPTSEALLTGHPPLSFYVMGLSRIVTGSWSEFAMRMPSVIFGVLTVVAVYFLGRELFDRRTGLIASAILAVLPVHVLYSRQALPVSQGIFFSVVAAYFIYRSLEDPNIRNTALAGIAGLLAIATHFMNFALFFYILVVVWVTRDSRDRFIPRPWIIAGLVLLVAGMGFFAWEVNNSVPPKTQNEYYQEMNGVLSTASIMGSAVSDVLVTFPLGVPLSAYVEEGLRYLDFYFGSPAAFTTIPLFFLPLVLILYRRRTGNTWTDRGSIIAYGWFVTSFLFLLIPIYAMYYANDLSAIRGNPFFLVPIVLLIAQGIDILLDVHPTAIVVPLVLLVVYLSYTPGIVADEQVVCRTDYGGVECYFEGEQENPVGYYTELDWRSATKEVVTRASANDTIYASIAPPFVYYSQGQGFTDIKDLHCNVAHKFCNISEQLESGEPFWIVGDESRLQWQLSNTERRAVYSQCVNITFDQAIRMYGCGSR